MAKNKQGDDHRSLSGRDLYQKSKIENLLTSKCADEDWLQCLCFVSFQQVSQRERAANFPCLFSKFLEEHKGVTSLSSTSSQKIQEANLLSYQQVSQRKYKFKG